MGAAMNKVKLALLFVWLLICGWVLLSFLFHPKAWEDSEVTVLFHLRMLIITFPIGYVFYVLLTAIHVSDFGFISQQIWLVIFWLTFSLLGYVQWFIIVPSVYRKLKKKLQSRSK